MVSRRAFLHTGLAAARPAPAPRFVDLLPPRPGNPRNSEGGFVQLRDGRLLFAYSKFTGGGGDHDRAVIAARYSRDLGETWTSDDQVLLGGEGGMNVMSVSFLRLRKSGELAFFYIRKNSETNASPAVRFSGDEGRTWSDAVIVIPDPTYNVLNNDRVVQLKRGRLIAPVALHTADGKWTSRGNVRFYLSDDEGRTWRRSQSALECPDAASRNGLQEPGVVELKDGRLLMFARTSLGHQYVSHSSDGGDTWSPAERGNLASPLSPASIERIPKTGHLLAVWNDHAGIAPELASKRTPLTVAISKDEGRTWINKRNLLADPAGWYCYTAIEFVKDRVLLAYCATGAGQAKLSRTQLAWFPINWLYRT